MKTPRLLATLALALGLAACDGNKTTTPGNAASPAPGAPVASTEPIKVGVLSPFSGGSSPMGLSMRDGVRLAAEEINNGGGLLGGRKVQLVERDDEANPSVGSQRMQDLISNEKVVALLGPTNTGVFQASYRVPVEAKIPYLVNVSAGADVNAGFKEFGDANNFLFGLRANDTVQADLVVTDAVDKKGFKKVAVLCDATNYGQSGRTALLAQLTKRGVTPVYDGKFNVKDTDMTPQLQEARTAGAEALLVWGIGPELASVANSMEKLGYKVPMIGGWTLGMSNFIDNAGPNGNGTLMPQTFIQNGASSAKSKAFVEAYVKKFKPTGDRIPVAVAAAQGYDSMKLLAAAITQAGDTDGTKVKSALEDLRQPYEGVIATFQRPFTASDHDAIKKEQVMVGKIQDGQVQPANK